MEDAFNRRVVPHLHYKLAFLCQARPCHHLTALTLCLQSNEVGMAGVEALATLKDAPRLLSLTLDLDSTPLALVLPTALPLLNDRFCLATNPQADCKHLWSLD